VTIIRIEKLNQAYWSSFWSHTFPDFDYVFPTDKGIHGLILDWERFKTFQTIDFFKDESTPLRQITPKIPITTNFMNLDDTLDYWAFSKAVDVICWDSYPNWHEAADEISEAVQNAFANDQCRSMKQVVPTCFCEG
jgi:beta-galactosidase